MQCAGRIPYFGSWYYGLDPGTENYSENVTNYKRCQMLTRCTLYTLMKKTTVVQAKRCWCGERFLTGNVARMIPPLGCQAFLIRFYLNTVLSPSHYGNSRPYTSVKVITKGVYPLDSCFAILQHSPDETECRFHPYITAHIVTKLH